MLMAVALAVGNSGAEVTRISPLFSASEIGVRMLGEYHEPAYDVAPDGQRFVVVQRRRTSTVLMVENWQLEFQGK